MLPRKVSKSRNQTVKPDRQDLRQLSEKTAKVMARRSDGGGAHVEHHPVEMSRSRPCPPPPFYLRFFACLTRGLLSPDVNLTRHRLRTTGTTPTRRHGSDAATAAAVDCTGRLHHYYKRRGYRHCQGFRSLIRPPPRLLGCPSWRRGAKPRQGGAPPVGASSRGVGETHGVLLLRCRLASGAWRGALVVTELTVSSKSWKKKERGLASFPGTWGAYGRTHCKVCLVGSDASRRGTSRGRATDGRAHLVGGGAGQALSFVHTT